MDYHLIIRSQPSTLDKKTRRGAAYSVRTPSDMPILLISEEEKKGHNNYLIFRSSSHNTFYVYQKGKMENSAEMNLYPPPSAI